MNVISEWRCFRGRQLVLRHDSRVTSTPMELSLYLPPQADRGPVPLLIFLSGLGCNWQNVTTKGGFQRTASQLGVAVVCPDTSPRGDDVPDDEAYDLGQGAGFYVDATEAPWSRHYRMYSYILDELPAVLAAHYRVAIDRCGIFGHSMGGHGALVLGLRNPDRFRSVSALAPIVIPSEVPWGQKAFAAYLGEDRDKWRDYDTCALLAKGAYPGTILVDQGLGDEFYESQLFTRRFSLAAGAAGQSATIRLQPGYDHSYFFVTSFMDDHIDHHAR